MKRLFLMLLVAFVCSANADAQGWLGRLKDKAVDGVYAGDYYAALIVPEDFSMDAMSFVTGTLKNPQLIYYENEKKNAIAPKITGKAKTAVQEQVNAAFVETLAKYVSDAATVMNASGYDPQQVFSDLGGKMEELAERLENCEAMLSAAQGLADSASSLMSVSDQLLGSAEETVEGAEGLLDTAGKDLPDADKTHNSVSEALTKEKNLLDNNLSGINKDLTAAALNMESYNEYVLKKLPQHRTQVENMRQSAERTEKYLNDLGYTVLASQFGAAKEQLAEIGAQMDQLEQADESTWAERQKQITDLSSKIDSTRKNVESIDEQKIKKLDEDLLNAVKNTRKALKNTRKALGNMGSDLGGLSDVLGGYSKSLASLEKSLNSTDVSLGYMKNGVNTIAEIFNRIGDNQTLSEVNDLLANNESAVAKYLASPVKMKTEVIYPIETYGSAMAPFYTVLAQWVGALLTAVLVKTNVKKRKGLEDLKLREQFLGRYALYLFIGLAQALIVSLGDLLYVGIQCVHPVLFVLQACMNGIVFMMINYALVFSLENIGLGAGVIILVLQVAGSGGTYPVEVLPKVFQVLYPVMPFRYSMNAMRECIAGTYGHTYAKCMGALVLFFIGAALFGQIMHRPAKWINRLIAESKEKSEIML